MNLVTITAALCYDHHAWHYARTRTFKCFTIMLLCRNNTRCYYYCCCYYCRVGLNVQRVSTRVPDAVRTSCAACRQRPTPTTPNRLLNRLRLHWTLCAHYYNTTAGGSFTRVHVHRNKHRCDRMKRQSE